MAHSDSLPKYTILWTTQMFWLRTLLAYYFQEIIIQHTRLYTSYVYAMIWCALCACDYVCPYSTTMCEHGHLDFQTNNNQRLNDVNYTFNQCRRYMCKISYVICLMFILKCWFLELYYLFYCNYNSWSLTFKLSTLSFRLQVNILRQTWTRL